MKKIKNIDLLIFTIPFFIMCQFGCMSSKIKQEKNIKLQDYYTVHVKFDKNDTVAYLIDKAQISEKELELFLIKIAKKNPNIHLYIEQNVKFSLIIDQILLFRTAKITKLFLHFNGFDETYLRSADIFIDLNRMGYTDFEPIPVPPMEE